MKLLVKDRMPSLKIGNKMARIPIIQGGMSVGISLSRLASAVANEGGIGVIGTAGVGALEPDVHTNYREANIRALRREIQTARKWSDGIIGINVMMALSNYDDMIQTGLEEKVDIIFVGSGLLLRLPDRVKIEDFKKADTCIVPIISSAHGVEVLFKFWTNHYHRLPDAVVLEGPMAGGHIGFTMEELADPNHTLEKIIPEVLKVVRSYEVLTGTTIPLIAGGGIYTGSDIRRILGLGASGVQMATRFVATHECDASAGFKQAYLDCKQEDIRVIQSPVKMPGRAIRNKFLEDVDNGKRHPIKCSWKCIRTCEPLDSPYCIALALTNARDGKLQDGFAFCGANAYRVDRITTVKELMNELVTQYQENKV